ncbi:helix-turn-helix domain-containing protein [Amycolatopsis benzoatilytica]|uniref:helix-turn-helix domain-containing protein n=1 Tax=Amycolatopsis benzoatilytica TaxID=346045 RepID=UPI000A00A6E2|nr:helix-turn-helix domain-containing protein [Amycolatopsis benzoatilytica]
MTRFAPTRSCAPAGERIAGHDGRQASDFATTLLSYLRCFGEVAAASAELHIHQNTLRQRLRRAQNPLGLVLAGPATAPARIGAR